MEQMKLMKTSLPTVLGGIAGVVGTTCYILTNVIPLNHIASYFLAMAWPLLSLLFVFSLFRYIAIDRQTVANQLAFLFACLGFTLVACMISVQLAVRWGMEEHIPRAGENTEIYTIILQSIRLVDHGIDVAWDLFIGTSLLFLAVALTSHPHFRLAWGIPSALLAVSLIVLNVIAFPWPPDTMGLFDVGPVIGLYIIALSIRLIWIGTHAQRFTSKLTA